MKNRWVFILLVLIGFLALLYAVSLRQGLLWLIGIGYGVTLRGYSFGFTTGWRKVIVAFYPPLNPSNTGEKTSFVQADFSGLKAQVLLIIILFVISTPILIVFPQIVGANASISLSLLIGAFAFGLFMQLADGCGSGTLYKVGTLKWVNLIILAGFIIGAFWGSIDIPFWLSLGTLLPAVNFLNLAEYGFRVSYEGALIPLGGLILVYAWLHKKTKNQQDQLNESGKSKNQNFNAYTKGAILLAGLAGLNLIIAGQPWGIVYGLGLWGAKLSAGLGVYDPSTSLFWQYPYAAESLVKPLLSDATSVTNLGLICGALGMSLLIEKKKRKQKEQSVKELTPISERSHTTSVGNNAHPPFNDTPESGWHAPVIKFLLAFIIGVLLGYSSRLAFGCNIGAFVSGISTGSLHGWVWFVFAFGGSIIGVRLRRLPVIRALHGLRGA